MIKNNNEKDSDFTDLMIVQIVRVKISDLILFYFFQKQWR